MKVDKLPWTPINFRALKETVAFFICEGVGAKGSDMCSSEYDMYDGISFRRYYYRFSYDSRGIFNDLDSLRKNAAVLQNNPQLPKMHRIDRLNRMVAKIKYLIQNTDATMVYLIGVSHGSLLLTAAYTLLKLDIDVKPEDISKIRIATLGSPRMPYPDLMIPYTPIQGEPPRLLNIYHTSDVYIKALRMLIGRRSGRGNFHIPDESPETRGRTVIFKKTTGDVAETFLERFEYPDKYVRSYDPKTATFHGAPEDIGMVKGKLSSILMTSINAHTNVINLMCVFDYFTAKNIEACTQHTCLAYAHPTCVAMLAAKVQVRAQNGGGKQELRLLSTKRIYTVRGMKPGVKTVGKTRSAKYIIIKGERVALSELRGKYRYINSLGEK